MDTNTTERLTVYTQIRHLETKIQWLEQRLEHLESIINGK
jgi:hypothetical protein